MLKEIPCTIFRGGTSKGLFFLEDHLPPPGPERDSVLLSIMGSPDLRQIDGLGGAVSTTSKVAIIKQTNRKDADLEYTFAQVAIDKPVVDYKGNCGNISAAVGPYAIEKGLVKATDPETLVRILNTNTQKILYSYVQTSGGRVVYEGDFSISGVPGTSSRIKLAFRDPAGAVTGRLLPTGNAIDTLDIETLGKIRVSIVDVSNPLVFVLAQDIGLTGKELPEEIDSKPDLLNLLERIRGKAAELLGFVSDWKNASLQSPAVPKMTIVSEAKSFKTVNGETVEGKTVDLLGRMMSMQKTHKTYALTGALCTAAAAVIPNTLVHTIIPHEYDPENLRIGHPGGIIHAGVQYELDSQRNLTIKWAFGYRTARMLMDGKAYYISRS